MKKMIGTGTKAVATAVKCANVDVVPGYPITPQTSIMEYISEMCDSGEMNAKFIPVEGEHSAMAAAVAASATGARVFTASSSQGLLYMHEVLHMAAGGRMPIVMVNVNRGVFAPWILYADHSDTMAQRDTGWLQLHCASIQEIFNTTLQAFYIAEKVNIPTMVCFDGFTLSHCTMAFDVPTQKQINQFLPARDVDWFLDVKHPSSFSNISSVDAYVDLRKQLHEDTLKAIDVVKEAASRYSDITGMCNGDTIECYRMEDAETVVFAMGSLADELHLSIDRLRANGMKVGLLRLRLFRPFPKEDIMAVLPENSKVVVIDKAYAYGTDGGALYQELKSALYGERSDVEIYDKVMGIGGQDVTWETMADAISETVEG
ncbi:MAG: pyruvate ferredoxin oxidoreductase [Clostridia bacterium]|nr:pyruvate ferredoxin oxidoreductase [Clostridia bacterium]